VPAFDRLIRKSKWINELLRWRQTLENDSSTRVISQNFNKEAHDNPHLHFLIEAFLNRLAEHLHTVKPTGRPEELIPRMADETPVLHLRGGSIDSSDQRLSRIMALEDINNHLAHHMGWPGGDIRPLRKAIEDGDFVPSGTLRTGRPFCWVTTTEYVNGLRTKHLEFTELSEALIRGLGLLHLDEMELGEIVYAADAKLDLKQPTVLDAGSNRIFRPLKNVGTFGRAVNLITLNDDGPEAVHKEASCGDGFACKYVGLPHHGETMDWIRLHIENDPDK
jgi:hypothetical protein